MVDGSFERKLNLLEAHCCYKKGKCTHGKMCRMNRTIRPSNFCAARGRPLGFLLAFMKYASSYKDQPSHSKSTRLGTRELDDNYSYEKRLALRKWCMETYPEFYAFVVSVEREQRPGEGLEPDGLY